LQIVPSTVIACVAILLIAYLGPRRGLWAFFAMTPFGAAAAFNLPALGGASITLADLAVVALFAMLVLQRDSIGRILATMRPFSPGFFLMCLLLYGMFATVFFPRIFAGQTEVFSIGRVEGRTGIVMQQLRPGSGNITQLFRLTLGTMLFLALATVFRYVPDRRLVVVSLCVATCVHMALGVLDVATYYTGLTALMEPLRTANYAMAVTQVMAGLKRMVGGFPEASSFGYYTMGLFGFWLQYWFDRGSFRYAGWLVLALTFVVVLSASTAAYVAAAGFIGVFVVLNLFRTLAREVRPRVAGILGSFVVLVPIIIAGLIVAYQSSPEIAAYFDRLLFNKLQSSSGVERMSWNIQALRNFTDTWMVGAGLGSVRASNWLIATLGSLGLFGTLLFLVFIASVFRSAPADGRDEIGVTVRALKMGCLGMLIPAMLLIATPNLELSFFAMAGLAVGLAAGSRRSLAAAEVLLEVPGRPVGRAGHRRAAQ
jgi:hypothetical protein